VEGSGRGAPCRLECCLCAWPPLVSFACISVVAADGKAVGHDGANRYDRARFIGVCSTIPHFCHGVYFAVRSDTEPDLCRFRDLHQLQVSRAPLAAGFENSISDRHYVA